MAYEKVRELEKYGQRHALLPRAPLGLGATTSTDIAAGAAATKQLLLDGVDPKSTKYKVISQAYDWAYQATLYGLNVADKNTTVQQIKTASNAAFGAGTAFAKVYAGYKSGKFTADASGIIDGAVAVQGFVDSIGKFGAALGWNPRVGELISTWSNVATGCTAMLVSNPPLGAIGCAASAILAVFTSIFSSKEDYQAPITSPRSLFIPDQGSWPLILADSVRLGSVLKAYYGSLGTTYEAFRRRLGPTLQSSLGPIVDPKREWPFYWLTATEGDTFPIAPRPGVSSPDKPIPAHNLRSILQMLDTSSDPYQAEANVRAGLAFCAAYRSGLEPAGRGLMKRYDWDNDINVAAIENMAWFGRSAIAAKGSPVIEAWIKPGGNTDGWYKHGGGNPGNTAGISIDLAPFIRLDELINFFAALSIVEMRFVKSDIFNDYGYGTANPVRILPVHSSDAGSRQGEPDPDSGFAPAVSFSPSCYTNLLRAVAACRGVGAALQQGSMLAFKEFGAMRLMAAFSVLHLQYMWSVIKARPADPLAFVQPPQSDLQAPLDPRQAIQLNANSWRLAGEDARLFEVQRATGTLDRIASGFGHGEGGNEARTMTPLIAAPSRPTQRFPNERLGWQRDPDDLGDWYRPAATNPAVIADAIQQKEAWARAAILAARQQASQPSPGAYSGGQQLCNAQGQCADLRTVLRNIEDSSKRTTIDFLTQPNFFKVASSSPATPVVLGGAALLALMLLKR